MSKLYLVLGLGAFVGIAGICLLAGVILVGILAINGQIIGTSQPEPNARAAETRIPQAAPTIDSPALDGIAWATYDGAGAPFSIRYPSDWSISNHESDHNDVSFFSPSRSASANVYYGRLGNDTLENGFNYITGNTTILSKTTNPDSSIDAELETDIQGVGPVRGYVRLTAANGVYYVAQFIVQVDEFEQYKDIGKAMMASLKLSPHSLYPIAPQNLAFAAQ